MVECSRISGCAHWNLQGGSIIPRQIYLIRAFLLLLCSQNIAVRFSLWRNAQTFGWTNWKSLSIVPSTSRNSDDSFHSCKSLYVKCERIKKCWLTNDAMEWSKREIRRTDEGFIGCEATPNNKCDFIHQRRKILSVIKRQPDDASSRCSIVHRDDRQDDLGHAKTKTTHKRERINIWNIKVFIVMVKIRMFLISTTSRSSTSLGDVHNGEAHITRVIGLTFWLIRVPLFAGSLWSFHIHTMHPYWAGHPASKIPFLGDPYYNNCAALQCHDP